MKYERAILIAFLGNYLINNLVAAIVALMGLAGNTAVQYAVYIALASIAVVLFTWWYMKPLSKSNGMMDGATFGGIAFVVAVVTAFVSGISGVITQTGSFGQVLTVLPNFWPFLANWSTLALLGYWVIPGALIGLFLQNKMGTGKPVSMV